MLGFYPIQTDAIAGEGSALQAAQLIGSGGGVAAGSAAQSVTTAQTGAGGGVAGGSAALPQSVNQTGAGGGVAGGHAPQAITEAQSGAGGGVAGGSATVTEQQAQTVNITGSGGGVAGGSAVTSTNQIQTVVEIGSGGAVGGGSAVITPSSSVTVQTPEIFFTLKRNQISFILPGEGRAMKTVNEFSSITVTLQFIDVTGDTAIPNLVSYQVIDEYTGDVLLPWAGVVPVSASIDVDLPDTVQQIVGDGDYEFRILSAIAYYNSNAQQATGEFRYRVRNLRSAFQNDRTKGKGGAVAGGSAVIG